jgi:cell division inhibitor SulA
MSAVVSLDALLHDQRVWRGHAPPLSAPGQTTHRPDLDAALPQQGWPSSALTEILLPADGLGELALLLPTLAQLTRSGATVALIAPPYIPYAPAWSEAGVEQQRRELLNARLLAVNGRWESHQGVCQLIATRLEDLTPLLGALPTRSRDFH